MPVGYFLACYFKNQKKNIKAKSLILSYSNDPKYKDINGIIYFLKLDDKKTKIYGKIYGLPPGIHAFHIHEFNDLSKGCESLGGHYNPFHKNHGSRVKSEN